MTVAELIEKLQALPQELNVQIRYEQFLCDVTGATIVGDDTDWGENPVPKHVEFVL